MSLIFGILQQPNFTPYSTVYSTPGIFNTTIPSGCTQLIIECWGGGGAGAGIPANTQGNEGGGAAGQYVAKTISSPTVGHTIDIQVAAIRYGTAGSAAHGNSSIVSINSIDICIASGGQSADGAAKGTGSYINGIGDVVYKGGDGANGDPSIYSGGGGGSPIETQNGNSASATTGGASLGGYSGKGGDGYSSDYWAGQGGANYGAGGSGAFTADASISESFVGGYGAQGLVKLSFN